MTCAKAKPNGKCLREDVLAVVSDLKEDFKWMDTDIILKYSAHIERLEKLL
jgi:hypothetical protein